MRAEELRIGNLLYRNYKDGSITDGQYEYTVGLTTFERIDNRESFLTDLQGIPLTEEWLVKFGFTKRKQERFFKELCYYNDRYNLYPNKDGSVNFNDDAGSGCTIVIIEYVHQLQNLYFALTGEELIIK